ncbi:MAG: hypothetical protein CL912_24100 [Deltaproteobacteria bacterium]|nr:hypothetical protein [Deltaproteobacteria bacterium]
MRMGDGHEDLHITQGKSKRVDAIHASLTIARDLASLSVPLGMKTAPRAKAPQIHVMKKPVTNAPASKLTVKPHSTV